MDLLCQVKSNLVKSINAKSNHVKSSLQSRLPVPVPVGLVVGFTVCNCVLVPCVC